MNDDKEILRRAKKLVKEQAIGLDCGVMNESEKVRLLYAKDKIFKKLFNLMFIEFGWAATEIDKDSLKIYNIFRKNTAKP